MGDVTERLLLEEDGESAPDPRRAILSTFATEGVRFRVN
jgi:hypothetical protein